MSSDYRLIARVAKAHGSKGEVVTVPVDGLPLLMEEGLRVCVVPPLLKGDRWHEVLSVGDGPNGQLVRLSGIDDLGGSEAIVGRSLLASATELPDDLAMHDAGELVGRDVVDVSRGTVGRIIEVMMGPANDVWVVDGEAGETLIPVVDEMVVDLPDEGDIVVDLPLGLVPEEVG